MSDSFKLGEHESKIEQLAEDMKDVKAAVSRIEIALAEKKGERRVGTYAVSFLGGGGGAALFTALWKVFVKH